MTSAHILGIPHPGYSPNIGDTICTYNIGSAVLGVAWSPDGMRLAMGNVKGQVQAWDANTELHVITFQAPHLQQRVEAVIWLPEGNAIAAAAMTPSSGSGTRRPGSYNARIVNTPTGGHGILSSGKIFSPV